METFWLVPLAVFFADEQRPILPPRVELAGVLAPLLKALPLAGSFKSSRPLVSTSQTSPLSLRCLNKKERDTARKVNGKLGMARSGPHAALTLAVSIPKAVA